MNEKIKALAEQCTETIRDWEGAYQHFGVE
jgi:hypothetical protein